MKYSFPKKAVLLELHNYPTQTEHAMPQNLLTTIKKRMYIELIIANADA
jgi:hypothetical protein